jgi:RND family efflux transporter MFP subunit
MLHRADRHCSDAGTVVLAAALAVIAAGLLVSGCSKKEPEAEEIVRPVKMMTIGAGAAGGSREYPGQVRAAEEIQLSFEVPGRLIELNAREGQHMAAGELIGALDPTDFEATRDRELARRNEARADYERNNTLFERDAISLRDLEVVRRRYEVTEANLRQAEKAVRDTRLYAPFDGKIAGRLVQNRENVTAKQPVVVFHDDSSLEIHASFPESDFLRIRDLGTVQDMTDRLAPKVEVSVAQGVLIDAWVKELRATADPVTRTYDVTLGFTPPAAVSITSGMTAKVIITMQGAAGTIMVPATAVTADPEGRSIVWVYDEANSAVTGREVVVGQLTGDEIEILGGLEDGDTIAILGASNLTEGMKVRPLAD